MADQLIDKLGVQLVPAFTLVSKALEASSGFIAAINEGGKLQVIHSMGRAPSSASEFEWRGGICGQALESGQVVHRKAGAGRTPPDAAEAKWEGGVAVALPVKIAEASPAVMAFHLPRVAQLSQGSLSLIRMGAEMCDALVNNGLLTDKIARSQREWQTMMDHLPVGIMLLDRDFKIKRCNQILASWQNESPRDLIGRRCHDVLHKADAPDPSCPHLAAMLSAKPVTAEFHSGERLFEITAIPMFDEDLSFLCTMELVTDITERRAMQKNLVSSERTAALAQMASKMAHEINNPLSFIVSSVHTLEDYLDDLKRILVQVEIILTSGADAQWEREKLEMKRVSEEIRLTQIAEETDTIIAEIKEGTHRIATIVKQLDMFNVRTAAYKQTRKARIDAIADRAIEMIKSLTPASVTVERAYAETPEVELDPSGMGHALIEICDYLIRTTNDLVKITFQTYTEGGSVVLRIVCTASGTGTALIQPEGAEMLLHNLHLAYGILQENGCRYDLSKNPNEGPAFTLSVPTAVG